MCRCQVSTVRLIIASFSLPQDSLDYLVSIVPVRMTACFYHTFIQAEITTANDELATAVYYETDKAFPSNAISSHESAFDDKFQIIAGKISGNADSVQQSSDTAPEEASFLLATFIVQNLSVNAFSSLCFHKQVVSLFRVYSEKIRNF